MDERRLPPVTQVAMLSLALIVAGGIYLSAHLPEHVPLGPAIILLALSTALMVFNLASLARVRDFPWRRFFVVGRWALLAYCITAGLIEYVFIRDHIGGGALVVLTLSVAVYAVHVPVLIAFTVARYHNTSALPDAAA